MRITLQSPDTPASPVVARSLDTPPAKTPNPLPPDPNPGPKIKEPMVTVLKNSAYVQMTAKEAKNKELPEFLQLELNFNPLKEGETISADPDSSIRHGGKP